jgi:hypothetical protein
MAHHFDPHVGLDGPGPLRPSETPPFQLSTAHDSFVTRYVCYAGSRTDAPLEAHELMAVCLLSGLAGPNPRIPIATSVNGLGLTLWGMYLVNTTTGRKTTVIELARDIALEILPCEAIVEWEGSPQGFIQRLQRRDGQPAIFMRDEYSGLLQQMNRGGHMAGLEQTFIRAFDGGVLENIRTRKRNKSTGEIYEDTDRVECPYLAKLTGATWDAFIRRATIDNVLDGFLPRFIFVTGIATPRPAGRLTVAMFAARDGLVRRARAFHERARSLDLVNVEDDVLEALWTLEQEWSARADRSARPEAAGPALKRLTEAVLKTAALLAIDRAGNAMPCITLQDFAAAHAMGNCWAISTIRLIEALGATTFLRDSDAVMETVKRHPQGLKLSELYGRHRQLKKRDFDELLAALDTQELIVRAQLKQEGRGRPSTMVVLGPRAR